MIAKRHLLENSPQYWAELDKTTARVAALPARP